MIHHDLLAFFHEEQNEAGVTVKPAPALLSSHVQASVLPTWARLGCTKEQHERELHAQGIILLAVASRMANE